MADEIIKELWSVKDNMALDHNYNLDQLVAHLRTTTKSTRYKVVDLRASKSGAEPVAPPDAPRARR